MKQFIKLFFISFIFSGIYSCDPPEQTEVKQGYHAVVEVVDGDTFWIRNNSGNKEKIRLIGIDAPESQRSEKKEIGFYGKEAKEYLTQLLSGKSVRLEYDIDSKDQYGRTLAYAFMEDGTFLNAHLVENGYATVYTFPPNVKYVDQLKGLQIKARENKAGLWQVP